MNTRTAELPVATDAAAAWRLNPFLHLGPDRVYNPLTDRMLLSGDPGYGALTRLLAGVVGLADVAPEEVVALSSAGWLLDSMLDPARQFLLKYVSLEAHTVCNQSCYFCPVSIAPREDYFMPDELYERIVGELAAYRQTIEAVIMINYNEPTIDKRFVEQVRTIKRAGLSRRRCRMARAFRPIASTLSSRWAGCGSCRSTSRRSIATSTGRTAAATTWDWCSRTSTT